MPSRGRAPYSPASSRADTLPARTNACAIVACITIAGKKKVKLDVFYGPRWNGNVLSAELFRGGVVYRHKVIDQLEELRCRFEILEHQNKVFADILARQE